MSNQKTKAAFVFGTREISFNGIDPVKVDLDKFFLEHPEEFAHRVLYGIKKPMMDAYNGPGKKGKKTSKDATDVLARILSGDYGSGRSLSELEKAIRRVVEVQASRHKLKGKQLAAAVTRPDVFIRSLAERHAAKASVSESAQTLFEKWWKIIESTARSNMEANQAVDIPV